MTASEKFTFDNDRGERLSGTLETGPGSPTAYALFAHCFTCDRTSLAAVKVSRALAERGIGVLRFDFTGLGESEGEFGRGLSGDVSDLVAAANAMAAAGMTPQLLIGHSFGGAAVLAAVSALEAVKAVAVIAAPFDAEHVLTHLRGIDDATGNDRVPVSIGGREFHLGAAFVDDIREQQQQLRIAELGRALLILHSPIDEIVSINNASEIFQTARHPKSFVSLDHADHLLRRTADADYTAGIIAAWSSRYLDLAPAVSTAPASGLRVEETRAGKFQVRVTAQAGSLLIDEPTSMGGLGSGPTPYDLLSAGLGACTAMTCRLYADRKGWPLERMIVEVGHTGKTASAPDKFVRRLAFEGPLSQDQQVRLLEIAERCPVHHTLTGGATVDTERLQADMTDSGAPDRPEDHVLQMEEACVETDGH